MANSREIKRRIKSIGNTKKITKAMELVSAAKMRKSVNRVTASRPYSRTAWELLSQVTVELSRLSHPLLEKREVAKMAVVVISSNRGLCGAFNANVTEKALELARQAQSEGRQVEFITFGKKIQEGVRRAGLNLTADFEKDDITSDVLKILPLARLIINDYVAGKYDQVKLIYTDFISSLSQKMTVKDLLPFQASSLSRTESDKSEEVTEEGEGGSSKYIFEPNASEILNVLLPRILEVQIYQSVLESEASEHSARMLTMRNASDAAGDIIDDLTLSYNQARQAGITREIAEISAGKIALEE